METILQIFPFKTGMLESEQIPLDLIEYHHKNTFLKQEVILAKCLDISFVNAPSLVFTGEFFYYKFYICNLYAWQFISKKKIGNLSLNTSVVLIYQRL